MGEEGGSRLGRVLKGCGGALLLLLLVLGVLTWRAGSAIDARVAALGGELAAFRDRPAERTVLSGAPTEGNAVNDYRAVEWILSSADVLPEHPHRTPPALERGHPGKHGVDLMTLTGAGNDALRAGQPLPPAVAEAVVTYAPVLQHLRDGLRRPRCDWALDLENGMACELPDLIAMRHAANLLAFSAELEPDPARAARIGLEGLAFGDDVARHGTIIGVMVGLSLKAIACESLERTLRARALPREVYEEVIAAADALGTTDFSPALDAERLAMGAELAHLSGRALSAKRTADSMAEVKAARTLGPLLLEREWAAYEEYLARYREALAHPPAERKPRLEAIGAELEGAWLLIARIAIPNLGNARDHVDESRALADALRVLAAAHLHRLETGAFPADASPLAAKLGGKLPVDPFHPGQGSLSYALRGDEVHVWSYGSNGVDDGGVGRWGAASGERKDAVLITRAPR